MPVCFYSCYLYIEQTTPDLRVLTVRFDIDDLLLFNFDILLCSSISVVKATLLRLVVSQIFSNMT